MLQLSYSKQIFQHILCQLIFFSHTVLCSYVKLCGFVFFFFLNLKNEFFQDVAVVKMLSVISTNSINTSDLKSHKKKKCTNVQPMPQVLFVQLFKITKKSDVMFFVCFCLLFFGGGLGVAGKHFQLVSSFLQKTCFYCFFLHQQTLQYSGKFSITLVLLGLLTQV